MTTKHVSTVRCGGHTATLIETRSHRLFVDGHFAGDCDGHTVHVVPQASGVVRMVIEVYAAQRGWAVR